MRPRPLALALVLPLLASPAAGTWSIVCVDTATGEVAVASATCLTNFDLKFALPMIKIGQGAGAAQAAVDINAVNRGIMWDGFELGLTPEEIFAEIEANGSGNVRSQQYGIVGFLGEPFSHTGRSNGAAATGVTGTVGTIKYAIQGNVLAGATVVSVARNAFVRERGDLSQRLLAAMIAAREQGGDGRCSCNGGDPTGCGAPPPSFEKSAHVGFMVVGRIGDRLGRCNERLGCANGTYHLDLNVIGGNADPDPVDTLVELYAQWRAERAGRPDGLLSTATASAQSMPADGRTRMAYRLRLVDLDGVPLEAGGATIVARTGDPDVFTVGDVVDHGDGTYSVEIVAGSVPGEAELELVLRDEVVRTTLFPAPVVRVEPVVPLHCGFASVSAARSEVVPLVVNEPEAAGAPYVVLGSVSGTAPGTRFRGVEVPLNRDPFFLLSLRRAGSPAFPGTVGLLDEAGHAQGAFVHEPLPLLETLGLRVEWSAVLHYPGGEPPRGRPEAPRITNVAGFEIVE